MALMDPMEPSVAILVVEPLTPLNGTNSSSGATLCRHLCSWRDKVSMAMVQMALLASGTNGSTDMAPLVIP